MKVFIFGGDVCCVRPTSLHLGSTLKSQYATISELMQNSMRQQIVEGLLSR